MSLPAAGLRARAEALAAPLPPLLAEAQHLAATVLMGAHGRRRPGPGAEFWQFRAARPDDGLRAIDWRRSARGDANFVRELEWQAAQTVTLWVDRSRAMAFSGDRGRPSKADRARLLALAVALLLLRADERVGLTDPAAPPSSGRVQSGRMALALVAEEEADYGRPPATLLPRASRAVFLSDFLGDLAPLQEAVARAADRGVGGALMQVLDPAELAFPFDGRTIFESMSGAIRFETRRALGLRERYLARLADREEALRALAARTGWLFTRHATDASPQAALLWLWRALERRG
ncbi:MAG: DUF58 domain-containing protein [Rhodobacteraceae bacterium]|nr:DUF58 domain-containing protein [Paracoccaceae bacterium]